MRAHPAGAGQVAERRTGKALGRSLGRALWWAFLVFLPQVGDLREAAASEPGATLLDLRYSGVVRQSTEFSCGAAAVASLLDLYFGVTATEGEVLESVQRQIHERGGTFGSGRGLSAYDLKAAAISLGVQLAGYEVNEGQLRDYFSRGGFPIVAHVVKPRSHYVVVVGIAEDHLVLCDPGWGRSVTPMSELFDVRRMSGIILVALPTRTQAARARREQAEALRWMIDRVSHLRELRETLLP